MASTISTAAAEARSSGAGLEQVDNFRAAFAGAFDDGVDLSLGSKSGRGMPATFDSAGGEPCHRHAAENERVKHFDADFAFHGYEGAHASGNRGRLPFRERAAWGSR